MMRMNNSDDNSNRNDDNNNDDNSNRNDEVNNSNNDDNSNRNDETIMMTAIMTVEAA